MFFVTARWRNNSVVGSRKKEVFVVPVKQVAKDYYRCTDKDSLFWQQINRHTRGWDGLVVDCFSSLSLSNAKRKEKGGKKQGINNWLKAAARSRITTRKFL